MTLCPLCHNNTVGKIGSKQFYCRECFIEFSIQENKISVYEVCDDGTLLPYIENNNQTVVRN